MSYKTQRYQEGLSGKKPGWIYLDKKGHRAQEAGYQDNLKNQDLARRINENNRAESGGSDDDRGGGGLPGLNPDEKYWLLIVFIPLGLVVGWGGLKLLLWGIHLCSHGSLVGVLFIIISVALFWWITTFRSVFK